MCRMMFLFLFFASAWNYRPQQDPHWAMRGEGGEEREANVQKDLKPRIKYRNLASENRNLNL